MLSKLYRVEVEHADEPEMSSVEFLTGAELLERFPFQARPYADDTSAHLIEFTLLLDYTRRVRVTEEERVYEVVGITIPTASSVVSGRRKV